MPFGLMNAPATFQRMMYHLFGDMALVKVYLDDIVIYSKDLMEHLTHLEQVFARLAKHGLHIRLKKCFLAKSSIKILGHTVSKQGVMVDMDKVDVVKNAPPPKNKTELGSFLGLASYYRRFIPGFARITQPLHEKTSEKVSFEWTAAMGDAFQELKTKLCEPPILAFPDMDRPFIVHTDASSKAC